MKEKILRCEYCNEETRHLVFRVGSTRKGSRKSRRDVKHCTECNKRTIKNYKQNRSYVRNYGNIQKNSEVL